MKRIILSTILFSLCAGVFAQNAPTLKWYGFIRNYYALDTRESVSGTEEFFYYLPKDVSLNSEGEDINANPSFRYAALTSRLGVDVTGYEFKNWKFSAKIETDFYNGLAKTDKDPLSGSLTGTAVLRLRQAYVSMTNGTWTIKTGQAWHPMAADMPDIFSLATGAPFGPFSRTPQFRVDVNLSTGLSLTAASIWQQQYTSSGPYGSSANYVRNGGGEFFLGLNYQNGGFLGRIGANMLILTPRVIDDNKLKVDESITSLTPFLYLQYSKGGFTAKFKTVYAEDGSHVNLNGGYAISGIKDDRKSFEYTPTVNSSSWLSLQYKLDAWQFILFAGYAKNYGTKDAVLDKGDGTPKGFYFSKNSFDNLNEMWRLTPTVIYNFGKFSVGVEYERTNVTYGDKSFGMNLQTGLYDKGLHDVVNNRVQTLVKFTF